VVNGRFSPDELHPRSDCGDDAETLLPVVVADRPLAVYQQEHWCIERLVD